MAGSPPLARGHALGGTISRPMPLSLSDTPDVGSRSSDRAPTLLNQESPWQLPLAMPQGPMHLPLRAIAVFHTAGAEHRRPHVVGACFHTAG